MDQERQIPKRDRVGFLQIAFIGLFVAALFFGGLRLLRDTHIAHSERDAKRSERAETAPAMASNDEIDAARKAEATLLLENLRRRQEQKDALKNTKCVGGTLFKVEGNSYTNIGRC